MLLRLIKQTIQRTGYDIVRYQQPEKRRVPSDVGETDWSIVESVRPYTMTSDERLITLINAVRFVSRNKIRGAIAECGVWQGGSMMAVALTLLDEGDTERDLYLYDTFQGMSDPTLHDKSFDGRLAESQLAMTPKGEGLWCYAPLDEVKANFARTQYPTERVHFIAGKIEDTIPRRNPPQLAILRLDTDWYESTKHELEHLFPLLTAKGILIIDDYGHWQGARKAVDEFLSTRPMFLHRIDETGRVLIK